MKTKQKILFSLIICLVTFISCKKANTTPTTPSNPQSFSAAVDSASVKFFTWHTTIISSANSGGTLLLTATKSDGTSMVIKMPYPVVLGSNYTQNWQTYNIIYNLGGGVTYQPSLGQVGVTSHNNGVLIGTFSGTMQNYNDPTHTSPEIDITNGTFTANVQ